MATIRTLYVALKAQTSDYNKAMKEAATLGKDFGKIFKPTQEAAKQMGTALVAVGAATGGALLLMAKKAANYGDEMLEASQKTGIGTKQLAALRLVAEQSGSSFEGITAGAVKLSKSLFDASTKGGEAAKIFNVLGIAVKDSTGQVRDASAVLPEIAERFSKMRDGAEKTALAVKIFGKSGADLIPTLNQGAAGFLAAQRATEKYNIALTEADAKLGDDFNDTMKETNLAMLGLSNQIGKALLPGMTKLVQIGNNVIAMTSSWAKAHPGLTQAIAATAGILTGAGGLLIGMSLFLKFAPGMIGNLKLLSTAFLGLSVPMRLVVVGLTALTAAFIAFPKVRGPVIEALAFIYQSVRLTADSFGALAGVINRLIRGEFTAAWETWKGMGDILAESWERHGQEIRDTAAGIGISIKDMNAILKGTPAEMPALSGMGVDLDSLGKSASEATNQVEQLWKQLKRENSEAGALEAVLLRAEAAHISQVQIIGTLGGKIKEVSAEFMALGESVPNVIAKYDSFIFAQEELARVTQNTIDKFEKERELLRDIAMTEVPIKRDAATEAIIRSAEKQGDFALKVKGATENLQHQREEIADLSSVIVVLNRQGLSANEIEQALGVSLTQVARRAKELGVQIDPLVKKMGSARDASEDMERSFGDSFASMADSLVDFALESGRTWEKFASIGKNTFKDLARSFLDGLIKPLKDGLRDLGETAGRELGKIIFGAQNAGGQQSSGGIMGGIIGGQGGGGILGGIFGGGGSTPTGGTPPFNPNAGAGSGGTLNSIMSWNPAGMASDAVDFYNKTFGKIGQGRRSADEIVKAQNAFVNDTLGSILGDSSLTSSNKLKLVNNAFDLFQQNLDRFSASGEQNAITANQSFASVSPLVNQIKADLIKAGASDGTGAGAGGINVEQIVNNFYLNGVTDVPTFIDWLKRNFGGLTEEIVRQVELREGAVVSR